MKNGINLIEKFLTPTTIEQLAKREEIEKVKELSNKLSKEITELRTLIDERGKSQLDIFRISKENLNKINDIVVSLKEKVEIIDKKSDPITIVKENIQSVKDKITELHNKLLGTKEKGLIGEKVVYEQLSSLPDKWLKKNVEFEIIGEKGRTKGVVEFAIQIGNKYIPIDSKVVNTPSDLQKKVKEMYPYVRASKSLGFGIMAIPDSLREEGLNIASKLPDKSIIIVPYSYLLYVVLHIIANEERILANINSEMILKDLPKMPAILSDVIHHVERTIGQLKSIQDSIKEVKDKLDNCYRTVNEIISHKGN